jgi:soluble lytic murein transglycosylase
LTKIRERITAHALLGLSLAVGDARGQLAIAVSLPSGVLTAEEKLRFLYPLPEANPILEALATQEAEAPMVLAIVRNESLFDPGVRSRAGALGLMQIMPFHFPGRGFTGAEPLWNQPVTSLTTGIGLLIENAQGFQGDPYRTVAAYNAGKGAVRRWVRQLGGKPTRGNFLAWIGYPETRRYTEKVLIDREIYDWILGVGGG